MFLRIKGGLFPQTLAPMLNERLSRSAHPASLCRRHGRNAMTYQSRRLEPQHDLSSDRIRSLPLKRADERAVIPDATAMLLRPPAVRRLAELLRPLPVSVWTAILAQAIREGTMTRAAADQVRIAIVLGAERPVVSGSTRTVAPCLDDSAPQSQCHR